MLTSLRRVLVSRTAAPGLCAAGLQPMAAPSFCLVASGDFSGAQDVARLATGRDVRVSADSLAPYVEQTLAVSRWTASTSSAQACKRRPGEWSSWPSPQETAA